MTRVVRIGEFNDPEPLEPWPDPVPEDYRPRFTYAFHDAVGECSKGHTFSEQRMRLDIARFFGGDRCMGDDKPPLDYPAYWDHLCPYCGEERRRAEQDAVKRANSTLTARHISAHKAWEIREAARGGVIPGRKPLPVRVEDQRKGGRSFAEIGSTQDVIDAYMGPEPTVRRPRALQLDEDVATGCTTPLPSRTTWLD